MDNDDNDYEPGQQRGKIRKRRMTIMMREDDENKGGQQQGLKRVEST
jgi:hypothetical protein